MFNRYLIFVLNHLVNIYHNYIIPNIKYNDAITLMDAGKYTEAITAFEALDGYKDSREYSEWLKFMNSFEYTIVQGSGIKILKYNGYAQILTIPAGPEGEQVETIGSYAFYQNRNLVTVIIPDGVRFIDAFAFSECSNLRTITMPESVTEIADAVFWGCTSLKTVYFANQEQLEKFASCFSPDVQLVVR